MPFEPPSETAAPSKALAYVLDDDLRVGMIVTSLLGRSGYDARQFTSPQPFLAEIALVEPALVILDLSLGQSDAVEVIHHLEGMRFAGRVLLMSGRDEGTLGEIQKVGMSHGLAMLPWLKKPFRPGDLRERLAADPDSPATIPNTPRTQTRKIEVDEAIANNWLELWYQPKVDLKSQAICGAEALLRVRHPQFGVMLPICVLPPSGDPRYLALTAFVIERAMSDWQYFCDEGHALQLAINAPVSVVQSPDFVTMVRKARPKHPKFPGMIIEITEDEMIRDPQRVREAATQLKLYDASLAVDDFGTAYSSLSRLSDLPCSEVKLDRSFVSGCGENSKKQLLCKAAVELAHGFGLTICAEGVETEGDRRMLVEIGCDAAQGYLFGRPMTARMLAHILAATLTETPEPAAQPVAAVSAA